MVKFHKNIWPYSVYANGISIANIKSILFIAIFNIPYLADITCYMRILICHATMCDYVNNGCMSQIH